MKDIQETLGHSSIAITGDTYTSVIHELETEQSKADAAALVPRTARTTTDAYTPAMLIHDAVTTQHQQRTTKPA
jgi:hypothetical protein